MDGRPAFVYDTPVASLCAFEVSGTARLLLKSISGARSVSIRPYRHNVPTHNAGAGFEFEASAGNYFIEPDKGLPLFLFANAPKPPPEGKVLRFGPGVHETGRIDLGDGGTLYLEGGAVVRGSVYAHGEGIRVCGPGLLDGSMYEPHDTRLLVFDGCEDLRIEEIMTIGTPSWNLVIGGCRKANVENVKLVGWVVTSDGIDVVGSREVMIRDCFLRNNDDCVAVKAVDYRQRGEAPRVTDWRQDVDEVLVEGCTMFNDRAGNVMEIGFETQTESIKNITFRNIDVLAGHGEGGVFTIHNGDRATVENILYEDIRVEHFYDKLIDFRIMHSRYSKDPERGHIRNVRLKNVDTVEDIYNTVSLVGGFDAEHDVKGISIENLSMGGQRISSPDQFGLYTKHASEVEIS